MALKDNINRAIPSPSYEKDINNLCRLFQERTNNIFRNIAKSPIIANEESHASIENEAQSPRVPTENEALSPRVGEDNPTTLVSEDPPELMDEDEPSNIPNIAQVSDKLSTKQHQESNHKYPTRYKLSLAAQQMEMKQIKEPEEAIYTPILDAADIPSFRYDHLVKSKDGAIWERAFCREIGRLAQGYKDVIGMNTIFPIRRSKVPRNKRVTYGRLVCDIRPQKVETHRVRLTAGGNLIIYNGTTSTPTAAITTIKTHWNSVVSAPRAKYLTLDIKDFYLNSKLDEFEYLRLPFSLFSQEMIELYKLDENVAEDRYVYWEIQGGMYGLPQAGILAHQKLKQHLKTFGYEPVPFTAGLWINREQNISFTLVVDDFGVKYTDMKNVKHLIDALEMEYKITVDMTGSLYCGVTLQ